jgi:hypothetical protein
MTAPSPTRPRAGTVPRQRGRVLPSDRPWDGPTRPYDLVKEGVVALVVVGALVLVLAAVFSSPDERAVTTATWASADPADVVATATSELAGTSGTATYGAPYNDGGGEQSLGPLHLQKWAGVRVPVDAANDFVVTPLRTLPPTPALSLALSVWAAASPAQRTEWATAYGDALAAAPGGDPAKVAPGRYGPVPVMTGALLGMARRGHLDAVIDAEKGPYATDHTRSMLFLADSAYLEDKATSEQHLGGDQWGMMNETGNYPGQSWLWLYTFWYQVKPFSTSDNADALVWGLMALLTLGFVLVPFIPGVRSVPRWIPVHRLVWREWYREHPGGR